MLYNAYAASPVHRFYQMWQQLDCSADRATWENPSGCNARLFPWVEVTVGAGTNGLPQAATFSTEYAPSPTTTTGEGSTAMGFYNMQQGDAPYFKHLADRYSMSDNFHQSVQGGTGANHIMLGHGDAIWFSDGAGNALTPPHNVVVDPGTANAGTVDEVENPDPASGTNNWYTEDGYGGGSFGSPSFGGGSYSDCADPTQPGVSEVVKYLQSLPRPIDPHCEAGHYYLLNNYNPGYFGNGNNAFTDTSAFNTVFTIPPSSVRSIGDELIDKKISWKYYGDQWNAYVPDPYQINYGPVGSNNFLGAPITAADEYCNICNPFQYDTSIMTDATVRSGAHPGHRRPLHRHPERHASGRFLRQAQRVRGRPSDVVEAQSVRGFHEEDRGYGARQSDLCGTTRRSSSPSMKAAATTTLVTFSRSISSATARAFR